MNCSAPAFTSFSELVMLPLLSSMTTAVMGCVWFSKTTSSWRTLLSRISKSSRVRFGTSAPCGSVTVA